QTLMRVDLLLEDAELVPEHHDLVKERLERDALLLDAFPPRLQDHLAALPAAAEVNLADAELVGDHFAEDAAELVDIHVDVELLRERGARWARRERGGLMSVGGPCARGGRGPVGASASRFAGGSRRRRRRGRALRSIPRARGSGADGGR